MMKFRQFLFIIQLAFLIPAGSFAQSTARVTVVFEPTYNGKPLKLTNQYYVNVHGDTLYIDALKFYISNFKLASGGGHISYWKSHLIDAASSDTRSFMIDHVPTGNFTSLQFMVGIDSAVNTSGTSDDLDPAKGMYWEPNTGHIMAKLEGRSKVCKTPNHVFKFHIGGYKSPYDAVRTVSVSLPGTVSVQEGKNLIIKVKVDVATWINGVDLSKVNSILQPGPEASKMADDYAKMFSIKEISYE